MKENVLKYRKMKHNLVIFYDDDQMLKKVNSRSSFHR